MATVVYYLVTSLVCKPRHPKAAVVKATWPEPALNKGRFSRVRFELPCVARVNRDSFCLTFAYG